MEISGRRPMFQWELKGLRRRQEQASKKTNTRKQRHTDRDVSCLETFLQRKVELRKVEEIPPAQQFAIRSLPCIRKLIRSLCSHVRFFEASHLVNK